jgi:hypothetical protein
MEPPGLVTRPLCAAVRYTRVIETWGDGCSGEKSGASPAGMWPARQDAKRPGVLTSNPTAHHMIQPHTGSSGRITCVSAKGVRNSFPRLRVYHRCAALARSFPAFADRPLSRGALEDYAPAASSVDLDHHRIGEPDVLHVLLGQGWTHL